VKILLYRLSSTFFKFSSSLLLYGPYTFPKQFIGFLIKWSYFKDLELFIVIKWKFI